jgi:hypothetical protein
VARALRIEGNREARRLAEQIEQACRAALQNSDWPSNPEITAAMFARFYNKSPHP